MEWARGMFWVISTAGKRQYKAPTTGITGVFSCNCKTEMSKKCYNIAKIAQDLSLPKMVKHFGFITRESAEPFECIIFIIMISQTPGLLHTFLFSTLDSLLYKEGAKSSHGLIITTLCNNDLFISDLEADTDWRKWIRSGSARDSWDCETRPCQPPTFPSQA